MAEKIIRIGKVSKVNYAAGMLEVTYPDLDNSVTDELPMISFNGEYKMPKVGEDILVLHLSNGASAGVVLGPYWNEANKPAVNGKDVFRKEMAEAAGKAYMQYKDGTVELKGPAVRFSCNSGAFTAAQVLKLFERVSALESKI